MGQRHRPTGLRHRRIRQRRSARRCAGRRRRRADVHGDSRPPSSDPTGSEQDRALTILDGELPATAAKRIPEYRRTAFGPTWQDVDGNAAAPATTSSPATSPTCSVHPTAAPPPTRILNDPYTGKRIVFRRGVETSAAVQIDHRVPLALAWRSGAWAWTDGQRAAFRQRPCEPRRRRRTDQHRGRATPAQGSGHRRTPPTAARTTVPTSTCWSATASRCRPTTARRSVAALKGAADVPPRSPRAPPDGDGLVEIREPDQWVHNGCPTRQRAYWTRKAARARARTSNESRVRAYRCDACHQFHVGQLPVPVIPRRCPPISEPAPCRQTTLLRKPMPIPMPTVPLATPPSKVDVAYELTRDAILGELLQPRERIQLNDIAAAAGCSRTPALSAVDRLARDGLVVKQRYGAQGSFYVAGGDRRRSLRSAGCTGCPARSRCRGRPIRIAPDRSRRGATAAGCRDTSSIATIRVGPALPLPRPPRSRRRARSDAQPRDAPVPVHARPDGDVVNRLAACDRIARETDDRWLLDRAGERRQTKPREHRGAPLRQPTRGGRPDDDSGDSG